MKTLAGINIQFPISRLLANGSKTVETRTYPLPKQYVNTDLVLIETPGRQGKFKARAIGIIRFSGSFCYKSEEEFYRDKRRHHVTPDSPWAWNPKTPKFGWIVARVEQFPKPKAIRGRRGIKFTRRVVLVT